MSLEITLPHIREFFPGSSSETQASSSLSSKCMGVFKDMALSPEAHGPTGRVNGETALKKLKTPKV